MRQGLDHLPLRKRRELDRIMRILFDERCAWSGWKASALRMVSSEWTTVGLRVSRCRFGEGGAG
jgi:hypothetical protein